MSFREDLEMICADMDAVDKFSFWVVDSDELREIPVQALKLSNRASNALERGKIHNMGTLLDRWGTLYNLQGIGVISVKEIKNSFMAYYYDTLNAKKKRKFWKKTLEHTTGGWG